MEYRDTKMQLAFFIIKLDFICCSCQQIFDNEVITTPCYSLWKTRTKNGKFSQDEYREIAVANDDFEFDIDTVLTTV